MSESRHAAQAADLSKNFANSYKKFEQAYGINIQEASKANLARLKHELSQEMLSPSEESLYQFVIRHLTLKHKTGYIAEIQESGYLLSLDERERQSIGTDNSHTARKSHETDNVFFTLGLGNHPSPLFLEAAKHVITVPIHAMSQEDPAALEGLWVCPHLSDFIQFHASDPVELSGTRFYFKNDSDFIKKYVYQYSDGRTHTRTVPRENEIFAGKDVCPGMAYQFIQHLQHIGGAYQKHILDTVNSTVISEDEKLKIISAGMTALMPGWMTLEAKIPVKLPINKPYITTHEDKDIFEMKFKIRDLFYNEDIKGLQKELDNGFSIGLPIDIHYASHGRDDLLFASVSSGKRSIFDFVMNAYSVHPHDKNIRQFVNLQRVEILKEICTRGDTNMLRSLLAAGADVKPFGYSYLILAATNNHKEIFNLLLDHGARPDKPLNGWLIVNALISNNNFDALHRVVKEGIADPRLSSVGGHHFLVKRDGFETNITPVDVVAGTNLLHLACANSEIKHVEELIKLGVDVHARTESGETPYSVAEAEIKELQKEIKEIEDRWENQFKECEDQVAKKIESFEKVFQGMDEAKAAVWSCIATIQQKIQSFRMIQELLKRHGVNTQLDKIPTEQCQHHRYIAIGVVTGRNKQGENSIVLGRKRLEKNALGSEFIFPGGFKDIHDANFLDAAAREVEEETGIPIARLMKNNKVDHKLLYQFNVAGADGKVHYHIEMHHFELGDHLKEFEPYAYDDLAVVKTIPLSCISQHDKAHIVDGFTVMTDQGEIKLKASNGFALCLLMGRNVEQELEAVMRIENDAHHMMCYAAKIGDIAELERLHAHHVVPKINNADSSSPLKSACDNGQLDSVKWLMAHGADLNAEGLFLLREIIKQHHIPIMQYLLSQPTLNVYCINIAMLYVKNPEMAVLLLNHVVADILDYPIPLNKMYNAIPDGFRCAIKFGFKEIAVILLSHWSCNPQLYDFKEMYKQLKTNNWQAMAFRLARHYFSYKLFSTYYGKKLQLSSLFKIYYGNDKDHFQIELLPQCFSNNVKINNKLIPHQKGSIITIDQSMMRELYYIDKEEGDIIFDLLVNGASPRPVNVSGLGVGTSIFFHQANTGSRASEVGLLNMCVIL